MLYETNMYFANASINAVHAITYIVHVCNLYAECASKTDVSHAPDNLCNLLHAVNVYKADTAEQNVDCEVGVPKSIAHTVIPRYIALHLSRLRCFAEFFTVLFLQ